MIVIDSDIFIDMLRGRQAAMNWLAGLGPQRVILPGYVAMEAIQGCRDRAELNQTLKEIGHYQVVWPDERACLDAMNTFATYRLSHGLGLLDALIAHTALLLSVPLYTFNVKHFSALPNLKIIQPYTKP